jgi:hypothetical protein
MTPTALLLEPKCLRLRNAAPIPGNSAARTLSRTVFVIVAEKWQPVGESNPSYQVENLVS